MTAAGGPEERRVRIAAVSFILDDTEHTIEGNLTRCSSYTREAAERRADVICFPETVCTAGTAFSLSDQPQGTWIAFFSALAAEHQIHIIAPYLVTDSANTYSRATIFDRTGKVTGWYDKVQLNGAERQYLTPGDALPVFDLDFGRIAVMLCMDVYFPEIARIYALKGAEVIFWPTMTHGPTQEALLVQARARAIDNSTPFVESNYACAPPYAPYAGRLQPGNARIIDHNGDILAQTGRRHGLAVTDMDLNETRLTRHCVLLRDPDRTREDLQELFRVDLYSREYDMIAKAGKK